MISERIYCLPMVNLENIATSSEADLKILRDTHLLLTGCTSFFGKWLVEALLYANDRLELNLHLTVLSRDPDRFFNAMPHLRSHVMLTALKGDILTADMERVPFTHAIHGANLPFDGTLDWPVHHIEAAVLGAKRLVDAAIKNGCRSLLFLSSGAAYRAEAPSGVSSASSLLLRENQNTQIDNLAESTVYSITKRFIEVYMAGLGQAHGLRVPFARCFAFAGPYMPLDGPQALGNFLADGLAGRDIVIKGDGTAIRSYMYGADLVVWLLALLIRGRHGVPYNVGSQEAVSILKTAEAVRRAFPEKNLQVRVLGQTVPGNAPSVYVPNTSRSETELGVACTSTLAEICAQTAKWMVNQRQHE